MVTLRSLLSDAHQRGLGGLGRLLDEEAEDALHAERIQRIQTQVVAAIALQRILRDMGFYTSNDLDLWYLINMAVDQELLTRREAGILRELDRLANEAKHYLVFQSRL